MSSQLRVWLLGRDRWTTETGNALLGREAFSLSKSQVQWGLKILPDGRLLQVTAACSTEHAVSSDRLFFLSEELISDITIASHAVIFLMEIDSDLSLSYFLPAENMNKESWQNFVKRKGVIVVTRGDRFREAQNKEDITVSFIDWFRNCGGIPGILFQATQERCILFDNAGSEDILNKQRDELIHMIDSRVLGGAHYTDIKFKEAELFSRELNKGLQELKQKVHKNTASLEEKSQKTDICWKHMNDQLARLQLDLKEKTGVLPKEAAQRFQRLETQLIKLEKNCATDSQEAAQRSERLEQFTELECKKVSEKAARDSQELEKQILELKKQVLQEKIEMKEEIQANRYHIEGIRGSLLWERIKSLVSSYPQLHPSRIRKPLLILILLLLLLLPLLSSLWPVTSNSRKEITALNVSSDLRRYVDLKLEQAVKRIQEIEKYLFGLNKTDPSNVSKIRQEMTDQIIELKERLLNETYPNNVSKIRQEMTDQIIELKERLLNETADLIEDIKKNITGRILIWDMIESLPLSLPLIMVLTLLVLLLTPVPLPVPWAWLLASLLAALLILQFLLLLVLLCA